MKRQLSETAPGSTAIVPAFSSVERWPADRHPVATFLSRLAPTSRRTQRAALRWIAGATSSVPLDTFPWSQLRRQHVQAIRQLLVDRGRAPATANRILSALRGVLRECWALGYLSSDDYQRAIDVPAVRGTRLPRGRSLETDELTALFQSCRRDPDPWRGARDAALLGLMFGCGLRRAEVVQIQLTDLRSGPAVRIVAKGNRERLVPIPPGAWRALGWWIKVRGRAAGALVTRLDGTIVPPRGMTAQAAYMALRRRARWAGVRELSPHDLRRSYVGGLLDAGVDLTLVQQLAGHAQIQTTARYDRRPAARLQDAARSLRVPF